MNQRTIGAIAAILACWIAFFAAEPALAADKYITRYLAKEPVAIPYDAQGNTQTYTPDDLSQGKELFKENCIFCHVGGTTVPDPRVSLTVEALEGATPPRTNVRAIADFMREPMTYDGSDISLWCREVTEDWMSEAELEQLAAFILRAAEKSPGWGNPNVEVR